MKLSTGEQRLVLLARTFVKDPQLIILDEPMHELDEKNIALVSQIIEDYMSDKEKTMIYVSHYNDKCTRLITNQKTL